jgi:outer membrane protein assembly factor BamA
MLTSRVVLLLAGLLVPGVCATARAQTSEPTRRGLMEQAQAEKAKTLHPYPVTRGERIMNKVEDITVNGGLHWHPYFESAYKGGGLALGLGYMHHVSSYNLLDVRGSYSLRNYKRAEVEFTAPRMFQRRGTLTLLGGFREATEVDFFGTGNASIKDNRTNFGFQNWYGSAAMAFRPTRKLFMLRGGLELAEWKDQTGEGNSPSVDAIYNPTTLPGLGTRITYLHTQGTVGLDWRPTAGYARRGGFYGVTVHDYKDTEDTFGFQQVDYEVVQHFPILRETWAISLRGLVQTTFLKDRQQIPYFLLPSLGGGDNLRGYGSFRFRDRNSLLLQGEWRIMVNRYVDTAFFYDAGKVAALTSDLDLESLKHDYGFGVRFHSPVSTPLRVDLARGSEGLFLVFGTSAAF